jgi:hypothetical protein
MKDGRVQGILGRNEISEENIMRLAIGEKEAG